MKPSLSVLFALAILGMVIPSGVSSWTHAQTATGVTAAKYKVIDMGKIPLTNGMSAAQSLEAVLNDLAGQGWRLVEISGTLITLTAG